MRLIPHFKGHDFFPHDLRLPFMRYKGVALAGSFIAMGLSLLLFFTMGFNYGVDFKGGSMVEVQSTTGPADIAQLRDKLGRLGLGAVQIQQFGAPTDVLIGAPFTPHFGPQVGKDHEKDTEAILSFLKKHLEY